jgi:hypothetical protein
MVGLPSLLSGLLTPGDAAHALRAGGAQLDEAMLAVVQSSHAGSPFIRNPVNDIVSS